MPNTLTSQCKVLLSQRMKHKQTLITLLNNKLLHRGAGSNTCIVSSMLGMPYKMSTFEVECHVHLDTMKQHSSAFVSVILVIFRVLCYFIVLALLAGAQMGKHTYPTCHQQSQPHQARIGVGIYLALTQNDCQLVAPRACCSLLRREPKLQAQLCYVWVNFKGNLFLYSLSLLDQDLQKNTWPKSLSLLYILCLIGVWCRMWSFSHGIM